jgi:uncharacterized protein (DUF885 family)
VARLVQVPEFPLQIRFGQLDRGYPDVHAPGLPGSPAAKPDGLVRHDGRVTSATQLADELLAIVLDADPVSASVFGIRDRDDRLPDISAEAEQALRERLVATLDKAQRADPTGLEQRLTVAVVAQQAEAMIDQIESRLVEYAITSTFMGPVAGLLFELSQVPIGSAAQARNFLMRLAAIPRFTETIAQRHREGVAAGLLPLRHLVEEAVTHLDRYVDSADSDPLLGQSMHEDDLEAERRHLLRDIVYPALRRYRDVLADEIAPRGRSPEQPGLCWLPGGRETYRRLARAHTTTDRTPAELHQTGLDIVAGLRHEYAEIGARALGTSDPDEVLQRLRDDPQLFWNDAEEMLESGRKAIRRAEEAAPRWFGRTPAQQCQVQAVPAASGANTPMAFYMPPALDGSRPGIYFANTYNAHERSRAVSEVTAFHEAVPGHHFQISLAQELSELPTLRRLIPINAYAEGWGLYTERLADEMGLYSSEVSRLGMLSLDSLRACRLVVDTGLHELGWSRQQAVDFMLANTTTPRLEVEAEVDRYIVAPGQALGYMVGRLEILRIRENTQRRLGDGFDIRAFHDAVLGHGALPLSTLDEMVAEVL